MLIVKQDCVIPTVSAVGMSEKTVVRGSDTMRIKGESELCL